MTNAGIVDLTIDQGTDWAVQIYWTDQYSVPFRVSPPIRMQVRDDLNQIVLERKFDPDLAGGMAQGILYNSATGLIQIMVTAAESENLKIGIYHYDLFASYLDVSALTAVERRAKLVTGRFIIEGRVTRDL